LVRLKQAAFSELQTVQKQRQAEAEHATRQTKIAINTLRREKDTLAEQVKQHWMLRELKHHHGPDGWSTS
jgi:hypothetical protein